MAHPSGCKDPNCTLTYAAHLRTISFAPSAMPTRNKGSDALQTNVREKRWKADHEAFERLVRQGYQPPQIDGSALREATGDSRLDIEYWPVDVDYTRHGGDRWVVPPEGAADGLRQEGKELPAYDGP